MWRRIDWVRALAYLTSRKTQEANAELKIYRSRVRAPVGKSVRTLSTPQLSTLTHFGGCARRDESNEMARSRFNHGRRMRSFRSVSTTKQRAKDSRPSSRTMSPTRLTRALAPGSRRRTSKSPACVPGLNWCTSEKSRSWVIRNRSSRREARQTSPSDFPFSPSDATVSTSCPNVASTPASRTGMFSSSLSFMQARGQAESASPLPRKLPRTQ